MGETTGIQWTTHTFNPWIGCEKVSPACRDCYASVSSATRATSARLSLPLWGAGSARHVTGPDNWKKPLAWNRAAEKAGVRARVFCASLADVFEDRPELVEPRQRLFALIKATPMLDWQLLTKRPENIRGMVPASWLAAPRANVWLGTTAEDQARWDTRVLALLGVPAALHFVSVEPMLGTIVARGFRPAWIIIGGESGSRARPFDLDAARRLVTHFRSEGRAVFVKQMGEAWARATGTHSQDAHGGTPELWPADLRVREMPR